MRDGKPLTSRFFSVIVVLAMAALGRAAPTTQPVRAERPNKAIEQANCVTAECHANVKAYKALHGPVNVNTCDACHNLLSAEKHTFEIARQKADLCTYCHEFDVSSKPMVHKPVAEGECLGCHDPHGGRTMTLVRENTMAELCARCHENTMRKKFLHAPVAAGDCDACHPSHASEQPKLVDLTGTALCLACHDDFEKQMANARFTHKALDEGCDKCHDVHASDQPAAVTKPLAVLCTDECHKTIKADAQEAKYPHSAVLNDRACMTCHTAHGSDLARLMSDLPLKVCMNCHKEEIRSKGGRAIAAVPEVLDPNRTPHGPIREGQCNGCHNMHGGERMMLLAGAYSKTFYQKFESDKYELCFMCHDPAAMEQERAQGLTGFRDGERNLHYVHVYKTTRGRNCRTCHDTHAAKNDRNIRDWVQYGKWQLPINYERTETGGTCISGCHTTYRYDRVNPALPTTRPTTQRTGRIVRVPADQPALVLWSGKDVLGSEVKIPDEERPTVLLFLRAQQPDHQQVLKLALAALGDAKRARVLVVLNTPQAESQAKALVQSQAVPWPVVADPENVMARELGIHVWPTTVVVRSDGVQAARVGGAPQALTQELDAYVDFAAGKIDEAALEQRLVNREVVGQDTERKAMRDLRLVETMLKEGRTQQAKKFLEDALKAQPDSVPLRMGMIEFLIQVKRPVEAVDALGKLPAGALPDWQVELLRARALVAMNKREEAKAVLTSALAKKRDLVEAHYLMAQIYEQEKDWPKAAQAYRAALDVKMKQ